MNPQDASTPDEPLANPAAPEASGNNPEPGTAQPGTRFERDFLTTGQNVDDLTPLEEELVAVCKSIYDPEIPVPIWDLGLIYGWTLDDAGEDQGTDVTVQMTLTAPNCPAAETLPAEVEQGINALDSVRHVVLDLVFIPTYAMEMMSDEARLTLGFM